MRYGVRLVRQLKRGRGWPAAGMPWPGARKRPLAILRDIIIVGIEVTLAHAAH